jgi:hypothetical protein
MITNVAENMQTKVPDKKEEQIFNEKEMLGWTTEKCIAAVNRAESVTS